MGGASVLPGEALLNGPASRRFPSDSAAGVFADMWRYSDNLRAFYEAPELTEACIDKFAAQTVLEPAHIESRTLLTEAESKQLLAAYAIPVARTEIAANRGPGCANWPRKSDFQWCSSSIPGRSRIRPMWAGVELDLRDETSRARGV